MTFFDLIELPDIVRRLKFDFPPGRRLVSNIERNNAIVREMVNTFQMIAQSFMDTVHLYAWNGIIYKEVFRPDMTGFVKRLYTVAEWPDFRTVHGKEILEQVADYIHIECRNENITINDYPLLIPYKDKYFDLENWTEIQPSPDYYFTYTINIPLVNDVDCPMFQRFICQILPDPVHRKRVLCFLAYCMTNGIGSQLAHIWTGAGANGKTTLTNIMTMIIGLENICAVPIDSLMSGNRFVLAQMKDKQLNMGSEITYDDIDPAGIREFKKVITNRFLSGERKNKDPEKWVNITKHIFDVNELPLPKIMMDFAFYRRFHIIPFKVIIPQNEMIKDLDLILFQEEGPQIAAYIMSFYHDIPEVLIETPEESERLWFLNTLSVLVFVTEHCEIDNSDPNCFTETRDLYFRYTNWCKQEAKKAVSINQFGRLMEKTLQISRLKDKMRWGYRCSCRYHAVPEKPVELEESTTIQLSGLFNTTKGEGK